MSKGMTESGLLLAVVLAFVGTGNAGSISDSAAFTGLRSAAAGTAAVVPAAAGKIVAWSAAGSASHPADVLTAFSQEVLQSGNVGAVEGGIARALGFSPTPDAPWDAEGNMPDHFVARRNPSTGEAKDFSVVTSRGRTEILLGYKAADGQLSVYLVSVDAQLVAAVRDGAAIDIGSDETKAGFEKELGFWVRYYDRTHPPK